MPNKKPVELCLSQMKRKPSKLELVLGTCLRVVRLITLLFNAAEKLWAVIHKFL